MTDRAVLDGEVAVVTGAGRNIGQAIAERFAEEGAHVIVADINEKRAEQTRRAIREQGGEAETAIGDVSTEKDAERIITTAEEAYGPVDILVNNAAVKEREPFLEMDVETFDRTLSVNLRGTFLCTRAAAQSMNESGGGRVVNVSSTSGLTGRADGIAYATSKSAILNFTRSAAVALAESDIRVNTLIPTRTGIRTLSPDAIADNRSAESPFTSEDTLVGRVGTPTDQASAALYLVSPQSSFVTGTMLRVDGGRYA